MVKPYLFIKLKDPQHYYLEDETIPCIIDLRLEKVLKDAIIRISFKGRSSSYSSGTRHHYSTIFTTEKEIPITEWNTASHLKKTSEIEFSVEVPSGVTIPSFRKLEGSEGGKIEFMIEANLEAASFLSKRSIQASHVIQVPLIAKVNINEHGIEKAKESSIKWPKHEDNANACVLSAWIPHEGCLRGKDVPIRVEFKQPDRYPPAKTVFVELVAQEFNASSKDILPSMTKQLNDKVVQKEETAIELYPEGGAAGGQWLMTSQIVVFSIPANITPTISNKIAKVMKLDYKLRITVKVPKSPSDASANISDYKDLSVNLPAVIGTTGTIHDSGFELNNNPFGMGNASETGGSLYNGYGGTGSRNGPTIASMYSAARGSINYGPPPPQPISPIGFRMPEPNYTINGYFSPHQYQQQQQMYPPSNNQFVLNTLQLPYTTSSDSIDSSKIEGMPMPDFSNNDVYPPPATNRQSNIVHDEMATLSSSPSASSTIDQMLASVAIYPPQQQQINVYPPPPMHNNDSSTTFESDNKEDPISNISASWSKMYIAPPLTKQPTPSSSSEIAINTLLVSGDKPNTPTPPPKHTELSAQGSTNTTQNHATAANTKTSSTSSSPSLKKSIHVTRIDLLESINATHETK